jgi:hypothetical protein
MKYTKEFLIEHCYDKWATCNVRWFDTSNNATGREEMHTGWLREAGSNPITKEFEFQLRSKDQYYSVQAEDVLEIREYVSIQDKKLFKLTFGIK